jgi:uncharacterized OsmC-like protein
MKRYKYAVFVERNMAEIVVSAIHIGGELIRVEFPHSQIIADHPVALGGTGTGPTPAGFVMAALGAASALAGRQCAVRMGRDDVDLRARIAQRIDQEGFQGALNEGPLPVLTYLGQLWRRIEIAGDLSAAQAEGIRLAMSQTGIARTLSEGLVLEESLVCHPSGKRAEPGRKSVFHMSESIAGRMAEGERRVFSTANSWRVSCSALDEQTCIADMGSNWLVLGAYPDGGRGPTPAQMLLGGLASCTAIHVARYGALEDIPVEAVKVMLRAEVPDDPALPIRRIDKICEVVGELGEGELAKLRHVAKFCAIGVTLQRPTPIVDEVVIEQGAASPAGDTLRALSRRPAAPVEMICDDQSCCLPPTAGDRSALSTVTG